MKLIAPCKCGWKVTPGAIIPLHENVYMCPRCNEPLTKSVSKKHKGKMKSSEYIELCKNTESAEFYNINSRILHAVAGMVTEAGELMDNVKKALFYGKKFDRANAVEELGDMSWYMSLIMDVLNITWEEVWELNIKKLKIRYPEKFNSHNSQNRDLDKEQKIFEGIE